MLEGSGRFVRVTSSKLAQNVATLLRDYTFFHQPPNHLRNKVRVPLAFSVQAKRKTTAACGVLNQLTEQLLHIG